MKKFIIIIIVITLILIGGYTVFQTLRNDKFETSNDIKKAQDFTKEIGTEITISEKEQLGDVLNREKVQVNKELDQELATSLINYWSNSYAFAPIVNSSVRINPDNTVEYSGKIDLNRAVKFAKLTDIPQNIITTVSNFLKPFGSQIPIYVKGTIEIDNNIVKSNVQNASVSIIPVTNIIQDNNGAINSYVSSQLSTDSNYVVKSLKVENQKFIFNGTLPKYVSYN